MDLFEELPPYLWYLGRFIGAHSPDTADLWSISSLLLDKERYHVNAEYVKLTLLIMATALNKDDDRQLVQKHFGTLLRKVFKLPECQLVLEFVRSILPSIGAFFGAIFAHLAR